MMKRTGILIWKELKEQQWALIAGSVVFVALPVLLNILFASRGSSGASDLAYTLVLGLGGVYAVLVGAHTGASDQGLGLEPFWRSRPIGLAPWLAVKYLSGAAVIILVASIALTIELVLAERWNAGSTTDQLVMLLGHNFTLLLLYSLAFLSGCLVGQPLQAALLSLPAGLLVYFLPVLVPRLEPWSVINLFWDSARPSLASAPPQPAVIMLKDLPRWMVHVPGTDWRLLVPGTYGPFALGHLGLSALAGIVSIVAVRRGMRITLGQKGVVLAFGAVFVALLGLTGAQIGSNLELKAVQELTPGTRNAVVTRIDHRGGAGVLTRFSLPERFVGHWHELSVQKFDLNSTPLRLWAPVPVLDGVRGYHAWSQELRLEWTADHPDRAYLIGETFASKKGELPPSGPRTAIDLLTLDLDPKARNPVLHRLALLDQLPGSVSGERSLPFLFLRRDFLYICDVEWNPKARVLRIDLRQPDSPVLVDVLELDPAKLPHPAKLPLVPQEPWQSLGLLEIPGLDPRERLEATLALTGRTLHDAIAMEGNLLVAWCHNSEIATYEIDLSSAGKAVFRRLGQLRATPIERMYHFSPQASFLRDGCFFALSQKGLTVYDVREPARPRRIGHYAAPREDFRAIAPLPGGDVLVAGRRLHVVKAPGRRDGR